MYLARKFLFWIALACHTRLIHIEKSKRSCDNSSVRKEWTTAIRRTISNNIVETPIKAVQVACYFQLKARAAIAHAVAAWQEIGRKKTIAEIL